MGENLLHQPFADHQRGVLASLPRPPVHPVSQPAEAINGDEEPYTIRCVCDYTDDDGNTVLCEHCNTWQHISCYYWPKDRLDDDYDHVCAVCKPHLHAVDAAAANQRQQFHRGPTLNEDRKARRSAPKSHKKTKTKDFINTNGWTSQDNGTNYNNSDSQRGASPRDQYGPPAKRPKTSHRHSGSLASNAGHRPRGPSTVKRMPPLSELAPDYFSPAFIRIHRDNAECKPAAANLHLTIDIADLLSTWLDDPSSFEAVTNGKKHNEILQRTDGTIEELETIPIEKRLDREPDVLFHGDSPLWPYLTVERDVASGEMIGELRGGIGHQDDYKADPENQWSKLRHPDHFVFFHPFLPIYIDCRTEGTLFRYVRRSCKPNLKMSTIITGAREYHFCFTALHDIPAGAEITVNWDPYLELNWDPVNGAEMPEAIREQMCSRSEALLSHFGGCACGTDDCLMLHFDRRIPSVPIETGQDGDQRPLKNGKKRKPSKRSPPDLGLLDTSRASSEAVTHADADEDMEDARSVSQSAGSKASRDNTPSGQNGASDKLSERERRKLLQQERLFEQMEHNQQQGARKKKRTSGSNPGTSDGFAARGSGKRSQATNSNPNTPAQSSRPNAYFGITPVRSPDGPSPHSTSRHSLASSPQSVAPPRIYVDAGTQMDPMPPTTPPQLASRPRKSCVSLGRRLLKKSTLSSVQLVDRVPEPDCGRNGSVGHDTYGSNAQSSPQTPAEVKKSDSDEAMEGAESVATGDAQNKYQNQHTNHVDHAPDSGLSSHPPMNPPAPPWQSDAGAGSQALHKADGEKQQRAADLHVDLPPPPSILAKLGNGDETAIASPDPLTPGAVPAQQTPTLSGAPPGSTDESPPTPAPAKKKMSLSAYMMMNRKKTVVDVASSPIAENPSPVARDMEPAKVKQEESTGDGETSIPS